MHSIDELIAGCKKRDRKAQKILYDTYSPVMLGICVRYSNDVPEAEDILQEGFLKIFQNIHEFEGKGHFVGWMKKIMVNTAITLYHRNKKHYFHDDLDNIENEPEDQITPESVYSTEELYKLIHGLPQGYKVIFNLYAIEGYKHKEIAEKLNIDESTSKSQYLRAKKYIRNELAKMEKVLNEQK